MTITLATECEIGNCGALVNIALHSPGEIVILDVGPDEALKIAD